MRARTTSTGVLVLILTGCSIGPGPDTRPAPPPATATPTEDGPGAAATPDDTAATSAPPDLLDPSGVTQQAAPDGADGQPRGLPLTPGEVDVTDVDAVAEAFALTMLTPDTALDISPLDATRRAARWMSPDYAQEQTAPRPAGGGAQWLALAQDQGYYTAELTDTAATEQGLVTTAPQDLNAERPYLATTTAHEADLPPETFGIVVYLTRLDTDAPWQVYDWYRETAYE